MSRYKTRLNFRNLALTGHGAVLDKAESFISGSVFEMRRRYLSMRSLNVVWATDPSSNLTTCGSTRGSARIAAPHTNPLGLPARRKECIWVREINNASGYARRILGSTNEGTQTCVPGRRQDVVEPSVGLDYLIVCCGHNGCGRSAR